MIKVRFRIEAIPESPGLRICTTRPKGVYVASIDPIAARVCFVTSLIGLVKANRLLQTKPGESIACSPINWDQALERGHGIVEVNVYDAAKTATMIKSADSMPETDAKPLRVDWFRHVQFGHMCIACDKPEYDRWVMERVTEDIAARQKLLH